MLSYSNGFKLYRRSKEHSKEEHFNETRLGEISTNWSLITDNEKIVLVDDFGSKTLYSTKHTKVLIFDTTKYSSDEIPQLTIDDKKGNKLRIEITHSPLPSNYSHCNINCYLTTADQKFVNELVPHDGYNKHPLKKKLRALRNEYKSILAYWFQ